jgi:hypothetical protein
VWYEFSDRLDRMDRGNHLVDSRIVAHCDKQAVDKRLKELDGP